MVVYVRQLNMVDYRLKVGYVSQESCFFKGTVQDKILMRRSRSDQSKLLKALEASRVNRFGFCHFLGYDMMIGEGGGG